MISDIFRDYYCGIFGYCSKHNIFKKYYQRVNFKVISFYILTPNVVWRVSHPLLKTVPIWSRLIPLRNNPSLGHMSDACSANSLHHSLYISWTMIGRNLKTDTPRHPQSPASPNITTCPMFCPMFTRERSINVTTQVSAALMYLSPSDCLPREVAPRWRWCANWWTTPVKVTPSGK